MKKWKILRIIIIIEIIFCLGLLAVAVHPQLIVGLIQKALYKDQAVNTYSPLHKPHRGVNQAGHLKITECQYSKEYPNSFLDIIYPSQDVEQKYPTLFYFHGGGFFGGSKDMGDPMAANESTALLDDLCAAGYTIVNVDYALVPDYHFPVPLIQANQAFDWAIKHAEEYHLDMDQVIIMGSSAGAIMASQLGSIITNPQYADLLKITPVLSNKRVKAIVVDDAPLDYDSFTFACKLLIGNYVKGTIFLSSKDKSRYNNISHATKDYPATFLLGSEYRTDMNELHEALNKVSVQNELADPWQEEGKKMPHCFVSRERTDEVARRAFQRLIRFLKNQTNDGIKQM